jgi:hypothetical protein
MDRHSQRKGPIIIAGGSGLIGRRLSRDLMAKGYAVTILSRSARPQPELPDGVEVSPWTPERRGSWEHVLAGSTAVVQLAGQNLATGRWTAARKRRFWESRVTSSRVLAEAAVDAAPRPAVFVQGSAVGYYGNGGDQPLTEASPKGEGYLANLCAAWEEASRDVESAGIRHAMARTGLVLGAEGDLLRRMGLPFRLGVGGPMGSGEQWMPWIHLADEARALRFLIETPDASGPFNLTSPEPVNNRRFSKVLGASLRRPSWLRVPAWVLRVALGEMSSLVLEGQRALPENLLRAGFEFRFQDLRTTLDAIWDSSAPREG